MSSETNRASTSVGLIAIFAAFVGLVVLISTPLLSRARVDLTDGNLYSLSPGSRQILSALDVPVTLRLYFSQRAANGFPTLQAYAQRAADLLYEYGAQSGGRVTVEIIDPEPFSEAEDEAVAFGLEAARGGGNDSIYFGLAGTNAIDGQEIIPFLAQQRENLLEYDLTQLISRLSSQQSRPRVALVTDLPMQFGLGGPIAMAQGRAQPYVVYEQLSQSFDVTALTPDFGVVPEGTDLLFVAHPAGLTERQLYAVDQFILKGGNAILFVDPYSEVAASMQQRDQFGMPQPGTIDVSSDLAPLFKAWGLAYDPAQVVLDLDQAQRVNMGAASGRGVVDYVPWLAVNVNHIDDDDIVTGELELINFAASGHMTLTQGSSLTLTPLITSSTVASIADVSQVRGVPKPDELIQQMLPTGETYILAARLSGEVPSAYPGGAPEDAGDETAAQAAHVAASQGPINVIIVADTDLLADNFWAQVQDFFGERLVVPTADNGRFVLNAAENMAGSDALISLRSRGVSSRPFSVIERMRSRAEREFATQQQILQNNLAATEARLNDLQAAAPEGDMMVSEAQMEEIERFRADLLGTRKQLRAVQRSLNVDIERLQAALTWVNILGIPALLLVGAGVFAWRCMARRKAA